MDYLRQHREVTSVLITGGDPMIMGATVLRRYIEPLLEPGLAHIESVRIGSKSLAYWPQRFVSDPDADDTLRLFEQVVASGRSLAFMAHFSHPRELESALAAEASTRIRATGAVIRTQAPADQDDQRRPGDLGHDVAGPGADGHGAVLHVRGAGHRPAGLLRGAARNWARHLQRRLPSGGWPVPHRARAVHVGDPRQGMRGRDRGCCRAAGFRPAHDPGPAIPTWSASRSSPTTTRTPPGSPT